MGDDFKSRLIVEKSKYEDSDILVSEILDFLYPRFKGFAIMKENGEMVLKNIVRE